MRTRRFTMSVTGLVAGGLLAASGCAQQSAAIRVGDDYVSRSDFDAQVDQLFDYAMEVGVWPENMEPRGQMAGSYDHAFVGAVITEYVEYKLTGQLFDHFGLELTPMDVDTVRQQYEEADAGFTELPEWYRDQIIELDAMRAILRSEVDPGQLEQASADVLDNAEVELNSRFGTWDHDAFQAGQAAVIPPDGPLIDVEEPDFGDLPVEPSELVEG